MRLAALYDIHGNLPALEAVLADIEQEAVDHLLIGGDVIAGPLPLETLACLQQLALPVHYIHGNAESEILRLLAGEESEALFTRAYDVADWVASQLTPTYRRFLSTWPLTKQFQVDGLGEVLFCHATPRNDVDVFTRLTPTDILQPIFKNLAADVVVCGHTHMQFDRMIGDVRVVNAGSVGMPYGRTGADWLLLDETITFKHTEYDLVKAAERIRQTDYPQADEFAANNVLQTPSETEALDVFGQMELKQA